MNKITGKKYILWDFDGTVINSEPIHYKAFQKTVQEMTGSACDVGWDLYKTIVGVKFDVYKYTFAKYVPCDICSEEYSEKKGKNMLALLDEYCPTTEGVAETVKELYRRGYRMCIASSSNFDYVDRYTEKIGLKDYFEFYITGDQVKNSKPDPEIFLTAAKKFGASPEECVVVEDSMNGVLAGKAGSIFTVGYQNYDSGDQDLSKADAVILQMKELAELLA